MQVEKDKVYGYDAYRVDGAPVAGRASDEYDDHWYVHVNNHGIYAFVPTHDEYGDHSPYEEIVVDESHDFAERWGRIMNDPLRLAETVKREVDATLIDRKLDAGSLKLYFHGSGGNGGGFLPDTIGSDGLVGASVFQEARRTAKEAVEAGNGDEDWSGWKILVTTESNGKGIKVAQFGFEELGAWSPKPEVEFDPTETYTGYGTDKYEAFRNALSEAREDGLTFDAVKGLAMNAVMDADHEGDLFSRVDISFCSDTTKTVIFWQSEIELEKIVEGDRNAIADAVGAYDDDWVDLKPDAADLLARQWKAAYENGEAELDGLISICDRAKDSSNWDLMHSLDLGGDNEAVIEKAFRDLIVVREAGDKLLGVTAKGDGIIRRDYNLKAVEWDEVEKVIADRLAKTDDEDEIAKLKGMLAAPVRPREFPPSPDVIASFETKAIESSGISR